MCGGECVGVYVGMAVSGYVGGCGCMGVDVCVVVDVFPWVRMRLCVCGVCVWIYGCEHPCTSVSVNVSVRERVWVWLLECQCVHI